MVLGLFELLDLLLSSCQLLLDEEVLVNLLVQELLVLLFVALHLLHGVPVELDEASEQLDLLVLLA